MNQAVRNVLIVLALTFVGTGVYMFVAPESFYGGVPGVTMTGPLNTHFVRDAGLAFLMSGCAVLWGLKRGPLQVAVCGAAWPCLHACLHIQMWLARGLPMDLVSATNLFAIQLPAWLALALALRLTRWARQPQL